MKNSKILSVNSPRRVLVFPGGNEVGLEIHRALKDCKEVLLFSASSEPNHADYVYKHSYKIDSVFTEGWVDKLNTLIVEQDIDYIFPAHDYVQEALLKHADEVNAQIISSPLKTFQITSSKRDTYKLFEGLIPTPNIFDDPKQVTKFPIFVKPDKGYGSQGAQKIDSKQELDSALGERSDLLLSEYLEGEEYTVDCFSDREKGLMFSGGRTRSRIRMGVSLNSKSVDTETNELFKKYAEIINQKLDLHGAWFFQLKQDSKGEYCLLEVNVRIAGTMALHRVLGVNFALLSIFEHERLNISIMTNGSDVEIDRALVNRYKHDITYNTVYVDLDQTLLVHNTLNLQLLTFLFQAFAQGKKIVLISKSLQSLDEVLPKWRIVQLFDEVIGLKEEERKAEKMTDKHSIYIDDSFSQLKDVADTLKIPTFHTSMVELLIDWRQ